MQSLQDFDYQTGIKYEQKKVRCSRNSVLGKVEDIPSPYSACSQC